MIKWKTIRGLHFVRVVGVASSLQWATLATGNVRTAIEMFLGSPDGVKGHDFQNFLPWPAPFLLHLRPLTDTWGMTLGGMFWGNEGQDACCWCCFLAVVKVSFCEESKHKINAPAKESRKAET